MLPDPWGLREKLVKTGVEQLPSAAGAELLAAAAPFRHAKRLAELTEDFVFFTPAPIYLLIPLSIDPFSAYSEEKGVELRPHSSKFKIPLFRGMEHKERADDAWNHVLFFLPHERWNDFKEWFGSVSYWDKANREIFRVRTQELKIRDPLEMLLAVAPERPTYIDVTAFVIDSTRGCWFFQPELPPRFCRGKKIFDDTKLLVEGLDKSVSEPFRYVETKLKENE